MSDAPRIRRNSASTGAQKWVALVSAPIFFLIAGTLANSGMETVSTVFALLAMAMPPVFLVLAIRDWVWAMRAYRARQTEIAEELTRPSETTAESKAH